MIIITIGAAAGHLAMFPEGIKRVSKAGNMEASPEDDKFAIEANFGATFSKDR